jgi:glycosyltransferase involved in cell wall biosynthesis
VQGKLGIEGFTVGYVGRLVEEKGLDDLLEAIALCSPDVRVLFVGDGDYKQALLERVARLQLGDECDSRRRVLCKSCPR